ncbi:MinD/ParA family protein [Microbacterium marmarense]|uniref:MinD/ParA family protein n=1 Tax=Microbacterium marmarense TaxID=3122051 RepID=A0ABU8LVH6_9MICO
MTPERTEHTPDDAEHGVLSDSGSLDTSGLGILGGGTAQVNVAMPAANDDDDFVDDEASIANRPEQRSAASAEEAARAKAFDAFLSQPVEPEIAEPAAGETSVAAEETGDVENTVADSDDDDPRSQIEDADVFSTEIESERSALVAPAPVTLTSKRLGEIEADRETADLLTADRLLDPSHVIRSEPEGAWQHLVYSLSLRRINLGDSKRAKARKELDRRIAAPLAGGARFVPVLSRKGGVGKTTVTTLLGMALADARDDRVIAIDANPDRGTLSDRISRPGGKTVRDLVRMSGEVVGFNDLSAMVARDETRLDVVASDADPSVSEAFSDTDYRDVARLAAHYYSLVLTDTGTGIVHSVMEATLQAADQLVVVAGLSVDEARLASETLTWLETNGYSSQVRNAVVVINSARPGSPVVQLDQLESHFKTRVRAVLRMPYDPHIAAGSAITFRDLEPETRRAARELAATVVEGLRSLASAA